MIVLIWPFYDKARLVQVAKCGVTPQKHNDFYELLMIFVKKLRKYIFLNNKKSYD